MFGTSVWNDDEKIKEIEKDIKELKKEVEMLKSNLIEVIKRNERLTWLVHNCEDGKINYKSESFHRRYICDVEHIVTPRTYFYKDKTEYEIKGLNLCYGAEIKEGSNKNLIYVFDKQKNRKYIVNLKDGDYIEIGIGVGE